MELKLIESARVLADIAHQGQVRGDGKTPYIKHPALVAKLVRACEGTPQEIAAAWLHDVLEDTDMDPQLFAKKFGPEVFDTVLQVTFKRNGVSPYGSKRESRAAQLSFAKDMTPSARLIKLADVAANMYDLIYCPPAWSPDAIDDYADHLLSMRIALSGTSRWLESRFDVLVDENLDRPLPEQLIDEA